MNSIKEIIPQCGSIADCPINTSITDWSLANCNSVVPDAKTEPLDFDKLLKAFHDLKEARKQIDQREHLADAIVERTWHFACWRTPTPSRKRRFKAKDRAMRQLNRLYNGL